MTDSKETKAEIQHFENADVDFAGKGEVATPDDWSDINEAKVSIIQQLAGLLSLLLMRLPALQLMRKIDWHLIPWLSFCYLLSFLGWSILASASLPVLSN